MTLSTEDGKLFYQLWFPLLNYVNKKYKVQKSLEILATAPRLDLEKVKFIADKLWDDVSIIDEYLVTCSDMPKRHQKIIASWKKAIHGHFILERHVKKGSILICVENETVYQVCGIVSSLEGMFRYAPMPLLMEATLIPFENVIITDGLFAPCDVSLGPQMAENFKGYYMTAKKEGTLRRML